MELQQLFNQSETTQAEKSLDWVSTQMREVVVLFLSEILRSRRTTIARAADISSLVLEALSNVSSETEVLNLLEEIEKDFEEVTVLKQALHFGYRETDIKVYEKEIREFAAELFSNDMVASAEFLQNAAQDGETIQQLCLQHPDFCKFLMTQTDKAALVENTANF